MRFLAADREGVVSMVSAFSVGLEGVLGPSATGTGLVLLLCGPLDNVTLGAGDNCKAFAEFSLPSIRPSPKSEYIRTYLLFWKTWDDTSRPRCSNMPNHLLANDSHCFLTR